MTTELQSFKEKIEALDREAIPGPWFYWDRPDNDIIATGENEGKLICALAGLQSRKPEFEFIAFARTALPALLRIAEELEAKLKVAEDALKFVEEICDETLEHARVGTGEEVALRHAKRKATAALAEIRGDASTALGKDGGIPN